MILPKMTYEEMRREIERDSENFHRWLPHQRRRILEVARRCKSFPSHMMMRYPSPRKNNWLIHVLLTSTNMSGAFITYCIVRRDEEGVFVHLVMENAPGMVCQDILTPHCLKRYAERRLSSWQRHGCRTTTTPSATIRRAFRECARRQGRNGTLALTRAS